MVSINMLISVYLHWACLSQYAASQTQHGRHLHEGFPGEVEVFEHVGHAVGVVQGTLLRPLLLVPLGLGALRRHTDVPEHHTARMEPWQTEEQSYSAKFVLKK